MSFLVELYTIELKKKEIYVDKLMYNLMAIFNESLSLEEKQALKQESNQRDYKVF